MGLFVHVIAFVISTNKKMFFVFNEHSNFNHAHHPTMRIDVLAVSTIMMLTLFVGVGLLLWHSLTMTLQPGKLQCDAVCLNMEGRIMYHRILTETVLVTKMEGS